MTVKGKLTGFVSWNGFFYGIKKTKNGEKYYKSQNVRFDDTCGITEECTNEEYTNAAKNYAEVMNWGDMNGNKRLFT